MVGDKLKTALGNTKQFGWNILQTLLYNFCKVFFVFLYFVYLPGLFAQSTKTSIMETVFFLHCLNALSRCILVLFMANKHCFNCKHLKITQNFNMRRRQPTLESNQTLISVCLTLSHLVITSIYYSAILYFFYLVALYFLFLPSELVNLSRDSITFTSAHLTCLNHSDRTFWAIYGCTKIAL